MNVKHIGDAQQGKKERQRLTWEKEGLTKDLDTLQKKLSKTLWELHITNVKLEFLEEIKADLKTDRKRKEVKV